MINESSAQTVRPPAGEHGADERAPDPVEMARSTAAESTMAPSPRAWRQLPNEVRQQIRLNYPPKTIDPAHARAAVAFTRHRRRLLRPAFLATLALIVIGGLWTILITRWSGIWAPTDRVTSLRVLLIVLGVDAAAAITLGALLALAGRMEAGYLAAAVADVPDETPAPLTLTWRFSRPQRALHAIGAALAIIVYVFGIWAFGDTTTKVFDGVVALLIAARFVYMWPWPIASSYPALATLDEQGIRVHPLGLVVPWHRITRVTVVGGFGGPALVWRIEDPAAIAGAAPVSPGQQRRLLRWMTSNGGAIRLSGSQMRELPEVAYVATTRFRTFRVSQYSGLPSVEVS